MSSGVAHLWDFSRNHVSQRSGTLPMKPLSSDEKLIKKILPSYFLSCCWRWWVQVPSAWSPSTGTEGSFHTPRGRVCVCRVSQPGI